MSAKKLSDNFRTWIEIDARAARHNYRVFRRLIGPKVKLWAVVKSNAYGHGIFVFSKLLNQLGVDGFCVDSCVEGLKLRQDGIRKPILVLGHTLPTLLEKAAAHRITVTVSNFEALKALKRMKHPPSFHLKVDTGMNRQGFYPAEMPRVTALLRASRQETRNALDGVYTHFSSAKDVSYPTYTDAQSSRFQKAVRIIEKAGLDNSNKKLVKHCAATGATMMDKKYHCDAVRVGIGLYGLYPSKELKLQLPSIRLKPILSWRTLVSEVKNVKAGEFIGYDLVERVTQPTKMAVLPVGYWHGFPRHLSGVGNVLINGRSCRVLGRVSMDLFVADATGIRCRAGDTVTLIGRNSGHEIQAEELARKCNTIHYEFLTRLNPLIERVLA